MHLLADTFHHVRDMEHFETPFGNLPLPHLGDFQLTKFMVLQVVAGLLTLLIFKGGEISESFVGVRPKAALQEALDSANS